MPFSAEFDVTVDEQQLRGLLTLAGIPDGKIPASYALCWLANPVIRNQLTSRGPAGRLPVFARQMFSSFEPLRLQETYRLSVAIAGLPQKQPALRVSYVVRRDEIKIMQGEADILYLQRDEIAGL